MTAEKRESSSTDEAVERLAAASKRSAELQAEQRDLSVVRRHAVAVLQREGWSLAAIGEAVGRSKYTIAHLTRSS